MSDKISDVIKTLENGEKEMIETDGIREEIASMKEEVLRGLLTEEEYFIAYGKAREQLRILDALMNSDLDSITVHQVRKLIRQDK